MLLSIVHGDGIFEHECKNQLNEEQSKSNVFCRSFLGFQAEEKMVSKRNQSFANRMKHPPLLHTKIAFLENFALSIHYMKNFFNEGLRVNDKNVMSQQNIHYILRA